MSFKALAMGRKEEWGVLTSALGRGKVLGSQKLGRKQRRGPLHTSWLSKEGEYRPEVKKKPTPSDR